MDRPHCNNNNNNNNSGWLPPYCSLRLSRPHSSSIVRTSSSGSRPRLSSCSSSSSRKQQTAWLQPNSRPSVFFGRYCRTVLPCQWCLNTGVMVCRLTIRFCGWLMVQWQCTKQQFQLSRVAVNCSAQLAVSLRCRRGTWGMEGLRSADGHG